MPLARVWDTVLGFSLLCQFSCVRAKKHIVSECCILPQHHSFALLVILFYFKNIVLYLILLWGNKNGTMLRMVSLLKDCSHIVISFIHMVKIF